MVKYMLHRQKRDICLLFREKHFFGVVPLFFDFERFLDVLLFDLLDGFFWPSTMCHGPARCYVDSFSDNILLNYS